MDIDISALVQIVDKQAHGPLVTIGSGGSFSSASFAAAVHEQVTQELARALTPLEFLGMNKINASVMCFSASGRNRDIITALTCAAQSERGPVSAIVMKSDTPVHAVARKYSYCRVAEISDASFKDGFLAVATLLASSVVMTRAYALASGESLYLPETLIEVERESLRTERYFDILEKAKAALSYSTVSLLYSPLLKAAATDLESRFVEAALGNIHAADFRNFGHGRHHWIAKRGQETGILALVSDKDELLANRTLGLIPQTSDICRIDLHGNRSVQTISALIVGLYLSCSAGDLRNIDPGKPGVPGFGRKLYHLSPGRQRISVSKLNRCVAIRRKCQVDMSANQIEALNVGYVDAIRRLSATAIQAIVFDYDGTLCGEKHRYGNMPNNVAEALVRLSDAGVSIGIATGRGGSAGAAMRASLPQVIWRDITVGYYNGGVVTNLLDERMKMIEGEAPKELLEALSSDQCLGRADIRSNAVQVTIRIPSGLSQTELLDRVRQLVEMAGYQAGVCASGHSVDILMGSVSKRAVVAALQRSIGVEYVLRIGDKGRSPGNDADLLDDPFGLSVDEVSDHPNHCWNFAPAGVRGIQATLYYLKNLKKDTEGVRLVLPRYRGGTIHET